jgi:peptidoglycan/xylan/chitin deacetylase (PgdA/CDA1 family)
VKKSRINNSNNLLKQYHKYLLVVTVILFFIGGIMVTAYFRPVSETPSTTISKIPKEIKKELTTATPSATIRVPILLYHYVEYVKDKKDTKRQSLDILPSTFDKQIKTLQDAGYTFMTASELADVLDGKATLPVKPILITFDDGHWDLDTDILPILKKYNVKATAYIISGFIGGSDFLSANQLKDVINSGLVEIGAHTVHHIALAKRFHPIVQFEVNQSKSSLETDYNLHIVSFAYPDGSFDQQAIDVVKAAGFRTAVSTLPGIEQNQTNRFYLYRIRPGARTGDSLLDFLQQKTFKPW